jgi:thymidylate synthase
MNKADRYYLTNLDKIVNEGCWDENPRPKWSDGTPAYSKFITQVFETYDISKGEFPIPTLRNTAIKTGIKEIFWIYQKQSNKLSDAHELGINWWDNFDIGDTTIGMRYGYIIKKYDLMNKLLDGLKNNPFDRGHIINMHQYEEINGGPGLRQCAYETIWSVRKCNGEIYLDMTLNQRSNDYIIAGYINKTQYVALQMMVAGHCGYKPGKFCHLVQNLHIYDKHFDAVSELLRRDNLDIKPRIILKENKNFYDYTINDFEIIDVDIIPKLSMKLEIAI